MSDQEPTSRDHLEHAQESIWEAVQMLEHAQRVLFKAGDCYVARVWGDGVRAVIEVTERLTELTGDLTTVHIDLSRLGRKDSGGDPGAP